MKLTIDICFLLSLRWAHRIRIRIVMWGCELPLIQKWARGIYTELRRRLDYYSVNFLMGCGSVSYSCIDATSSRRIKTHIVRRVLIYHSIPRTTLPIQSTILYVHVAYAFISLYYTQILNFLFCFIFLFSRQCYKYKYDTQAYTQHQRE